LLALDARLPAALEGKHKPANATELLALAELCARYKKRHAAAARFYADAFAARPGLADDLRLPHRYNAACAAAQAAAGEGRDAPPLGEVDRLCWRVQAYTWLRADLAAWATALARGTPEARREAAGALAHWQKDPDLAPVRQPEALLWMHPGDARAWCD